MLNSKEISQKSKGFSLIELILWIALFSILLTGFLSLLAYTRNVLALGDLEDEILLSGRYGIEYIKEEILSADKIIPSYKIKGLVEKYPNSFNFVILSIIPQGGRLTYNFSTYYLKNDELTRIAVNKFTPKYPEGKDFAGHNQVATMVLDIGGSWLDISANTIKINLSMGYDNREVMSFKSTISLRCSIDI